MDSIHFLSMSKSYFVLSDKYIITKGQDFYRLEGCFIEDEKEFQVVIKYKLGRKRDIHLNLRKLTKVNELVGRFPVVLIAPDDIRIVKGISKDRRDYFNKWLCQADKDYLNELMTYNRLLRQKDALLKNDIRPRYDAVEAFNYQMIPLAKQINERINKAINEFAPTTELHYSNISNHNEVVSIKYLSELNDTPADDLFASHLEKEVIMRRPLVGIQKDDFEFLIGDQPLKKFGSQGQIKSWLYALRLSEYDYLTKHLEVKPILILDDYFEKLDNQRLSSLLDLISSNRFGQVFLSDTELKRSAEIMEARGINFNGYYVDKGKIELQ